MQKRSIHVERSQKVIETNLILHSTPHAFGQPSPDRSTVVPPDCVEILLKQNKFATMALPLHKFSLALPRTIHRNHRIQRQLGNVQMFNDGSNVGAIIICEEGVGRPTQACLHPDDFFGKHFVDDSCKACKLT